MEQPLTSAEMEAFIKKVLISTQVPLEFYPQDWYDPWADKRRLTAECDKTWRELGD